MKINTFLHISKEDPTFRPRKTAYLRMKPPKVSSRPQKRALLRMRADRKRKRQPKRLPNLSFSSRGTTRTTIYWEIIYHNEKKKPLHPNPFTGGIDNGIYMAKTNDHPWNDRFLSSLHPVISYFNYPETYISHHSFVRKHAFSMIILPENMYSR